MTISKKEAKKLRKAIRRINAVQCATSIMMNELLTRLEKVEK